MSGGRQAQAGTRSVAGSVGRNAPCPCGSGLKYKRCCALKAGRPSLGSRLAVWLVAAVLIGGLVFFLASLDEFAATSTGPQRVWSEAHQHWH